MTIVYRTSDQERIEAIDDFVRSWNDGIEVFNIKTSGSTGTPKSIELKRAHMEASAEATCVFFGLDAGDTILHSLSSKTIGGIMMLVRALTHDLDVIVVDVTSEPLKNVRENIQFAAMVPLQLEACIKSDKLDLIDTLIIGGAPISKSLELAVLKRKTSVYQTFGMTETISHIALRNVSDEQTSYEAVPGVLFEIVNEQLVIRAPHIGQDRLITHDLVQLNSNTSFTWLGRSDFAINSGGYKFIPEILEQKMNLKSGLEFYVHGIEDDRLGQKIVVVTTDENKNLVIDSIENTQWDKYEKPKSILIVPVLNYTAAGKLDRIKTLQQEGVVEQVL